MAILRAKEIAKMSDSERSAKLKELKIELTKANVAAHKTNAKTKEIKRAVARIITFNTLKKKVEKNKSSQSNKDVGAKQ